MGCTSSTQIKANPSTAEKSIQFEDEYITDDSNNVEKIIYRAADDINVLPSCDTLSEPVHLVRNKSTSSFKNETVNPEIEHKVEIINKTNSRNSLHPEEKAPKLEGVVEKVVELHMTEHINDIHIGPTDEKVIEEPSKIEENEEKHSLKESHEGASESKDVTKDDGDVIEEDSEEALSPTQSESSRATRWEALADIAAELPASLTIDPITGQIYSLSK